MMNQVRLLHTSRRLLNQQQQEPRNEALEYLAAKAARKQASASKPPSRHLLFYRDILPPFLRVIAWGSSAYFALHLTWNLLDRDEQRTLMQQHTTDMQNKIKSAVQESQNKQTEPTPKTRGWFDWLGTKQ